jgi:hypothetical protein
MGYDGEFRGLAHWCIIPWECWRPMAQSRNTIPEQIELAMTDDNSQPYGKLKWVEVVILIGAVVGATIFLLFYFL